MNNNDFLLADFFEGLGCNLPALIMLVVGMAVTYSNWQRHPAAARWAMLGFAWLLVIEIASTAWQRFGMEFVFPNLLPNDPEEVLSTTVLSCCRALGYFCFLLAVNAARAPQRPRSAYDESDDIDIARPRP
jgi:hypothetical protein